MKKSIIITTIIVISFASGVLGGYFGLPRILCDDSSTRACILDDVPDVRQSTDYSCGASALQAILEYWGIDKREKDLMDTLKTNETSGTNREEIIRAAKELGLKAEMKENLTIEDIKKSIENKVPVIVAIQAWVDPIPKGFSWTEAWEDGHYVVVIGVDDKNVYCEDPSLLGTRGVIPISEFLDRWHDYDGEPPLDANDTKLIHFGIFIQGNKAVHQPLFTKIE